MTSFLSTLVGMERANKLFRRIHANARLIVQRIRNLPLHPDFQQNPMKALLRRMAWLARWELYRQPWLLPFRDSLKIAVGNDGHGANLYYCRGQTASDIGDMIIRFLKTGMTFVDVGSHFGTFALLAAHAVGPDGKVHAFEPHPAAYRILVFNIRLNKLSNTFAHRNAVADTRGFREFDIRGEAMLSSLAPHGARIGAHDIVKTIRVETLRLDDVFAADAKKVNLIKVDVEGAELMVFSGAAGLLSREPAEAPVWIFEYEPVNYARFGYMPRDLMRFLLHYEYGIWSLRPDGRAEKIDPFNVPRGVNDLIAAKEGAGISSSSLPIFTEKGAALPGQ